MEKQQISAKVETISPAVAISYLNRSAKNRRLSEKKVQDYAKMMLDDEWRLNGEPIIIGKSGNLIDGQHRLKAVIYAGKRIEMLVVEGVDDDTFDTIDSGKSRSLGDVFSTHEIQNSQLVSSIVKKFSLMCCNKTSCFFRDYSKNTFSRRSLLNEYFDHRECFDEAAKFGNELYNKKRLASPANTGAIYSYLVIAKGYEHEYVRFFFNYLFSNKEYEDKKWHAANIVRGKIIDAALSGKRFEPKVLQNMFAIAWNAYVKEIDVKRVNTSGDEIIEFE